MKIKKDLNKADAHIIIIAVFNVPLKMNDTYSERERTLNAIFKPKKSIEKYNGLCIASIILSSKSDFVLLTKTLKKMIKILSSINADIIDKII